MEKYIIQLLEDIQVAMRPEDFFIHQNTQANLLEKKLKEIENWVHEMRGKEHPFGYYCGLKKEIFPAREKLKPEEMTKICKAFEKLLKSWNAELFLPKDIPIQLRYQLTVDTLNEDFYPIEYGTIGFDFCSGEPQHCALGRFCSCI